METQREYFLTQLGVAGGVEKAKIREVFIEEKIYCWCGRLSNGLPTMSVSYLQHV